MPTPTKNLLQPNHRLVNAATSKGKNRLDYRILRNPGLVLRVHESGTAGWYFNYSVKHMGGRKRFFKIADRGKIALVDVIAEANALRERVRKGGDPFGEAHAQTEAMTFRQLAEKFLGSGKLKESTASIYRITLEAHVFDDIGDMAASAVTPDHVLKICRKIEHAGHGVQSERTKSTIGGCYRYGVKERYVQLSPTAGMGSRIEGKPVRERTPSVAEVADLWRGMDDPKVSVSPAMKSLIRLVFLTGVRRDEAAGARKSEFDLDAGTWTIPGDVTKRNKTTRGRTKNGRPHVVYLSKQVIQLVEPILANADDHLFPANMKTVGVGRAPRTPHINGQSVTTAMRRLRAAGIIEDITVHDARRAIAAWLKDQGVSKEVRDTILNHRDSSVDAVHYSGGATMRELSTRAWAAWGDCIETALGGDGRENVVPLRAG